MITTVGIDVGGKRKGFHAVALTDGRYADQWTGGDVDVLAAWCRDPMDARVIAIDAPGRWSRDGRARPAERALMRSGIFCFSTPLRQRALEHPRDYFGWMLRGEALYNALAHTHPLCDQWPAPPRPIAFETFPHAITWHLSGGHAQASDKRPQRRRLLENAGIDTRALATIDLLDAALCALVAHHVAAGLSVQCFGDAETGHIVVPAFQEPLLPIPQPPASQIPESAARPVTNNEIIPIPVHPL